MARRRITRGGRYYTRGRLLTTMFLIAIVAIVIYLA